MTFAMEDIDRDMIQIRPANESDYAIVLELFYEGVDEGRVRNNDTGADVDNLVEGYFSDEGESGFWVATIDSIVVGMVGVQKTSDDVGEIRRLRVGNQHRRCGVGTCLMEHALTFCRTRSYLKVVLDVQIDRVAAIAMFEKFGFKLARSREINERKMLDFLMDLYSEPEV